MEDRIHKQRTVCEKWFPDEIRWEDFLSIKDKLEPSDNILFHEEYRDEGEERVGYQVILITRYTLETDEEYFKRIGDEEQENKAREQRLKDIRYKRYLELKQEFEII